MLNKDEVPEIVSKFSKYMIPMYMGELRKINNSQVKVVYNGSCSCGCGLEPGHSLEQLQALPIEREIKQNFIKLWGSAQS